MTQARAQVVETVRGSLMRRASPRLHMAVLVGVTALTGFATSYLLLHAGLTAMALRYPLALGVAYVAFLGLVRLWLRRFRLRSRGGDGGLDLEVIDLPIGDLFSPDPEPEPPYVRRGGGSSGGQEDGGASWGDDSTAFAPGDVASSSGGGSSGGGWGLDLDDGALWLIPLALVGAIAFGVVAYVVMLAPTLFAELLLDIGLAAGLYRRLARMERRSWLTTAIRSTIVPACFAAALLAAAGAFMQSVAPDAVSIGGVVRHVRWERAQNAP